MKLELKVIAVTGAGSGIGRALVLALLARGAQVAAIDLHADALAQTAALTNAPDRLSLHVADISDRMAVEALPDAVMAQHGAIDGLINNAGIIQPFIDLNDLKFETIDRVLDVNLGGTINMTKAFLPHLLARPEAHLTNVSSMGGFLPFPGQSIYGAAKAGVKLLTEGLYAELVDTNVGVSVVMPGAVATNIMENSGLETPSSNQANTALPADQAARIILDGMQANRLHILVGNDARMMWYMIRTAPRWSIGFIQRKFKALLSNTNKS